MPENMELCQSRTAAVSKLLSRLRLHKGLFKEGSLPAYYIYA